MRWRGRAARRAALAGAALVAWVVCRGDAAGAGGAAATSRATGANREAAQPGVAILDTLLAAHVRDGWVDYDGLARDRAGLDAYLASLASFPPAALAALERSERIALYLNAYNACTLDLMLEWLTRPGRRIRSIREIPDAWTRRRWPIAGEARNLDEIEHQILRREFREPRIHAALVCASRSCPALRSRAYRGRTLDEELDAAARAFLRDPTRNDFTVRDGAIRISKIFDWYAADFRARGRGTAFERIYGRKLGPVLDFAARYLPPETVARLRSERVGVEYLEYDWSLNDVRHGG